MVDIYNTRRGHFSKCFYYNRDERVAVGDINVYVLKNKPNGIFYAMTSSVKSKNEQALNNMIDFHNEDVQIETNDDIKDIKIGSIVVYNGKCWYVGGIQQELHQKESEFATNLEYTTYLSLRRSE